MTRARKGKIAALPKAVREELCERLLDGQLAPEILPWVNGLPDIRARLAERWPDLPEITDGNVSEWRSGGYRDWLQDRKVMEMAQLCDRMADAAGQPPESLLRKVYTGRMLEMMETLEASDPAVFLSAGTTISALSAAAQREVEHKDKTRQKDTDLGLRKILVARKFVDFYDDARARELADNARQDDAQLPLLADYMLGVPDIEKLRQG